MIHKKLEQLIKTIKEHSEYDSDFDQESIELLQSKIEEPKYISDNLTSVPKEKIAYHDHAWQIALEKASLIYPAKMEKIKRYDATIIEVDENKKDRMILAHVFYKALMGVSS